MPHGRSRPPARREVAFLDLQALHASAVYSLVRGSLENLAAAFWILHPTPRNDRIERTLRWRARNFNEQLIALEQLGLANESTRDAKLAKRDAVASDTLGTDLGTKLYEKSGLNRWIRRDGGKHLWRLTCIYETGGPSKSLGA